MPPIAGPFRPLTEAPSARPSRRVMVEHDVLDKNRRLAAANRERFAARGVVAVNVLSAPGSGKTTLLERTIRERGAGRDVHVIEGDQATRLDADRIGRAGAAVVQVNTGAGCHLEADMVARAADRLDPPAGALLLIENVGNLVCPALFDLGERARVVVASVTEGHDKPVKYPHMFRGCDVVVLNKIDLLPHVPFAVADFEHCLRQVNPAARLIALSALHGSGMPDWYDWLRQLEPG